MNLFLNLTESFKSIADNRVRAILTMLIIAFGITALIGVYTAIDAIKDRMTTRFSSMGSSTFTIQNRDSNIRRRGSGVKRKRYPAITYQEATEFKETFEHDGIVSVNVSNQMMGTAKYLNKTTNANIQIMGTDENYALVANYAIAQGRNLSLIDETLVKNVVVIGHELVKYLFPIIDPVGEILSFNGNKYKIIGVFDEIGTVGRFGGDKIIVVPASTFIKNHGSGEESFMINVFNDHPEKMDMTIARAMGEFRKIRALLPTETNNFAVVKSDAFVEVLMTNLSFLTITAQVVAFITLFSAAIGLMNIMLVAVTERTREIGVRKAMGATKSVIMRQFLTEAVVICELGGAFGILLGVLAGNIIGLFFETKFIIPWGWVGWGILICTLVGLISGIYPAWKAAKLDPIESLRHE